MMKKYILSFFFYFLLFSISAQNTTTYKAVFDEFYSPEEIEAFSDGCSLACAIGWKFSPSSSLSSQGVNNYSEQQMRDGNLNTAWVEGVEGQGIGEKIEITFPAELGGLEGTTPFRGFRIINGYAKNEYIWKSNSRIKRMKIYFNGQYKFDVELLDSPRGQYVNWGEEPINGSEKITFEIAEVYPGTKYQDTAITELVLNGAH